MISFSLHEFCFADEFTTPTGEKAPGIHGEDGLPALSWGGGGQN